MVVQDVKLLHVRTPHRVYFLNPIDMTRAVKLQELLHTDQKAKSILEFALPGPTPRVDGFLWLGRDSIWIDEQDAAFFPTSEGSNVRWGVWFQVMRRIRQNCANAEKVVPDLDPS